MILTLVNLNISRNIMPQFSDISIEIFKKKFKHKNIIINSSALKPVQKEIYIDKINDMKNKYSPDKICNEMPVIISKDNYIIDGHHRWYYCNTNNKTINVYKFDYSVLKLLRMSHIYT